MVNSRYTGASGAIWRTSSRISGFNASPRADFTTYAGDPMPHIAAVGPVVPLEELRRLQQEVRRVAVSKEVQAYIVAIARASREHPGVRLGLSPRGSLALMRAAQAWSFLQGVRYVTPDAVKAVAPCVAGHRLILDPEREATDFDRSRIVEEILRAAPVPVLPHVAAPQA